MQNFKPCITLHAPLSARVGLILSPVRGWTLSPVRALAVHISCESVSSNERYNFGLGRVDRSIDTSTYRPCAALLWRSVRDPVPPSADRVSGCLPFVRAVSWKYPRSALDAARVAEKNQCWLGCVFRGYPKSSYTDSFSPGKGLPDLGCSSMIGAGVCVFAFGNFERNQSHDNGLIVSFANVAG